MRILPTSRSAGHAILTVLICALLAGCSAFERKSIAEYQIDAGSVKLSVTSVAPWDEVVDILGPNFSLEGDDAKTEISKNNAALERDAVEKLLLTLAAVKDPNLLTELKGSQAREGIAAKAEGEGGDDGSKPAGSGSSPAVTLEPMITYKAAAALYQEVKLLDNYLKHAVIPENYRPYLVRLQLAVLPNRRNQPFDIFTDLQFLPGSELLDSPLRANRPISEFALIAERGKEVSIAHEDLLKQKIEDALKSERTEKWAVLSDDEASSIVEKIFGQAMDIYNSNNKDMEENEKGEIEITIENLDATQENGEESHKRNVKAEANDIYQTIENLGGWEKAVARFDDIDKKLEEEYQNPRSRTFSNLANLTPKVVPLLVTDSLETAPERVTQRLIRNLQVLTSGTSGGTPFLGNLVSDRDELDQILTTDVNSLLAVSQLNDNAVRLRLGARYDASPNLFEMTARTHNITLLVNVPEPITLLRDQEDRQLRVLALTEMRDARTGKLLEDGRQESKELKQSLRELGGEYELEDREIYGEDSGIFCLGENKKDGRKAVEADKIMGKLLTRHVL